MTSYIAHHTKKKQILERKESDLTRLIKSRASFDKIALAAEQVREARASVLRVKRSCVVPKGDADAIYAKLDSQIAALFAVPVDNILREFGYSVNSELTEHSDKPVDSTKREIDMSDEQ